MVINLEILILLTCLCSSHHHPILRCRLLLTSCCFYYSGLQCVPLPLLSPTCLFHRGWRQRRAAFSSKLSLTESLIYLSRAGLRLVCYFGWGGFLYQWRHFSLIISRRRVQVLPTKSASSNFMSGRDLVDLTYEIWDCDSLNSGRTTY